MTSNLVRLAFAGLLGASFAASLAACKKKEDAPPAPAAEPAGASAPAEAPAAAPTPAPTESAAAGAATGGAEATLAAASGSRVAGTVTLAAKDGKVEVTVKADGLTPGEHGFHIHEKGDCSAPDAKSAGEHFNPDKVGHGAPVAPAHHAGDFGNLMADKDGKVDTTFTVDSVTLDDGPKSAVGKAFIIHEKADDLKTQPSGNAGTRVACGVVAAK